MNLSDIFRSGWGKILDLVYPPRCHPCGVLVRNGGSLCPECDGSLPRLTAPFCGTCGEEFEGEIQGDFDCPNCREREFAFHFARPAMSSDPRLMEMIHEFKYRRRIDLAAELGRLALEAFCDPRLTEAREAGWPLIPVPLHRTRLAWRHFNQAGEIVRAMSRRANHPSLEALIRNRATPTQVRLTRAQRLKNLTGAFSLSPSGRKNLEKLQSGVVLVDDVFTTGATVHECARVLRRSGIQKVVVVTVMRG